VGLSKETVGKSCEAALVLINLAWSSVAALAIAPLQDLLNLGSDTRMNLSPAGRVICSDLFPFFAKGVR
jgi:hypothetical protein